MNKKKKAIQLLGDLLFIAFLVIGDWLAKNMAVSHLKGKSDFILIKDIFVLHYLENRGAAFGMLQNQKLFFVFSAVVILTLFGYTLIKAPLQKKYNWLHGCIVLISAGAIGNMIDRIRYDYVVDFFYFILIDFPIFNFADIYVTIGVTIMAILYLFYYKEQDLLFLRFNFGNNKLKI